MIGNDIVDLNLARTQSNWKRRGFLEKVFTPAESVLLENFRDPHLMVWLLWSMKEAAYKAHQRRFSLPRQLIFQSLECKLLQVSQKGARGEVNIAEKVYITSSEITPEWVHSLAWGTEFPEIITTVKETTSIEIKAALKEALSLRLGVDKKELQLRKNAAGVPLLGSPSPSATPFSLSAHGSFAAYCFPGFSKSIP